jgi:hypothetical protein
MFVSRTDGRFVPLSRTVRARPCVRVVYGVQSLVDDACPGESCSGHGVVAFPVLEQGRPRGWRCSG